MGDVASAGPRVKESEKKLRWSRCFNLGTAWTIHKTSANVYSDLQYSVATKKAFLGLKCVVQNIFLGKVHLSS